MSIVVHLMRHGAPQRAGLLLGQTDEAPLAGGIEACLGRVRSLSFASIRCSDLSRARLPAQRIADGRSLPLHVDPRWRELDFGEWEGRAPETLPAGELARFWNDPDAFPPPRGECWTSLRERTDAALRDLTQDSLVVAHAGSMRAALSVLTGLDHRGVWALDLPYGALLSLRVWPGNELAGQVIGLRTDE